MQSEITIYYIGNDCFKITQETVSIKWNCAKHKWLHSQEALQEITEITLSETSD